MLYGFSFDVKVLKAADVEMFADEAVRVLMLRYLMMMMRSLLVLRCLFRRLVTLRCSQTLRKLADVEMFALLMLRLLGLLIFRCLLILRYLLMFILT